MQSAEQALAFSGKIPVSALFAAADGGVKRALESVRVHLGMDVAFISEFVGNRRRFRHVDTKSDKSPIKNGDSAALEDGYCLKVIQGKLPELIPNTADVPEAMAIPDTQSVPIGSHLSVPLKLRDGRIYGTFCCFSFTPDTSLNDRDLQMMKAFAELVAYQIETDLDDVRRLDEIRHRIRAVIASREPSIEYQPTFSLRDNRLIGAESLSRFLRLPRQTPDLWFADAAQVGLESQLELKAIQNAIEGFRPAWRTGIFHLGLNCSPNTIINGDLRETISTAPWDRLIIEITEHAHVGSYDELNRALAPFRALGVKIAIDDVGSGYASMRHVLNILPDIIKLDVSLTREIDTDRTRRALASALSEFCRQTECRLVAEGIETLAQLETLRTIGADAGQGYYLGRPVPYPAFETDFIGVSAP